MAIPGNKLSSEPVVAPYLDPDGRTFGLNEDWEAGPKYVNDTSEGLSFQAWHLTYAEIAGYNPSMMIYNGSAYYDAPATTTSGNQVTVVCRFKIASSTTDQKILQINGTASPRVQVTVKESDHASVPDKLQLVVWNDASGIICNYNSSIVVADDAYHVALLAYDGDAGTAVMYVDGVEVGDVTAPIHTLTTGTVGSGTGAGLVGASTGPALHVTGEMGYIGYHDTYLTNFADFMDGNSPKQLDETGWTEWGSQPLWWNASGKMTENKGSAANLTQVGTFTEQVFPSGGTFTITPEDEGAPYVVLSGQNSVQCTFAFDNNARPTVAWVDDTDQGYLYWYSPIANDFIITTVATPVVGIALTLDDKRITQQQANDILAWYTLPSGPGQHALYMRRQRDRYDDIYEMLNPAWPYIHKCGMNEVNRVQLDLSTEAPA